MSSFHTVLGGFFLKVQWQQASLEPQDFLYDPGWFSIFVRIQIWSNLFFNDFGTVPKIYMVSIFVRIPIWSNLLFNDFRTVPKAPITIGITVTFLFHSICSLLAKS